LVLDQVRGAQPVQLFCLGFEDDGTSKQTMPRRWFEAARHTHVALDDAIEQGLLFCNMLAECRK
jgi:hypothetical protein